VNKPDTRAVIRWIAVGAWVLTPAFLLASQFVSLPLQGLEDLATLSGPLLIAIAIAAGNRIGIIGAAIGAGLAALVTFLAAFIVSSGCLYRCGEYAWVNPIGAAALTLISILAAMQMRSRLSD
jgi:hypothetical protein